MTDKLIEQSFAPSDESEIERKIDFELDEMQLKMAKAGGITNIISGIFVVWGLYNHTSSAVLYTWYAAIFLISTIEIIFSLCSQYYKIAPHQIKAWRKVYYVILGTLCLTWSSVGFLFSAISMSQQVYLFAFLLAVLVGFSFGTITNFMASLVSITCLLAPYIAYRLYAGAEAIAQTGHDTNLNFGFGIILLILGLFLLLTCYIGYKLIKKSFTLSFVNLALNEKLENMNRSLEQRVKERTIELEKSLQLVTYQATHDLLTDLPNQRILLDYMHSAMNMAKRTNHMFAIVFFSLNEIEKITDGLGYQAGELVIKTVAQRFQKMVDRFAMDKSQEIRYTVTLSRKDVFVIILDPVYQIEEIEGKSEILFSLLDEPVYTEKQVLKLTSSIGVSLYPRDGDSIEALLMNADAAMLRAKQRGGNSLHLYEAENNANLSKQLELASSLHDALVNNEFVLQYQPFVNLKTGQICGMEALIRWESPTLGMVPPMDFISLAEANGIIVPLGDWVMRHACQQTKAWHDAGFTSLVVAINVSAKQLQQKNLIERFVKILNETNLDPKFVELELTESTAFQDDVIPILKRFKEMGFGLSIDDFGTGYSNLSNLKSINIDKLKIDKSFVQDVIINNNSKVIVSNTINLAKKMNVSVLAEGVETAEQLKFLRDNGCDMMQGYFFSRPLNPDVFLNLLKSNSRLVS